MLRSSWAPGASCPVLSCQCEEILRSSGKRRELTLLYTRQSIMDIISIRTNSDVASEDDAYVRATPIRSTSGDSPTARRVSRRFREAELMTKGYNRLLKARTVSLPTGIEENDVQMWPVLQRYICWSCDRVKGISRRRSGGPRASARMFYYQVSVSKDVTYQAQKLSLCTKLGVSYTSGIDGMDSSHLCHNRLCWRPEHLHAESHCENMGRNSCPGVVFDKSTGLVYSFCRHVPCCMRLHVVMSITACVVSD